MKKRLHLYRGRLNKETIAKGMNFAAENAQRLATDAEILLDSGRYASAVALAILSIEESGKIPILRSLALAKTDDDAEIFWKLYRTHTEKNIGWILPFSPADNAPKSANFKRLLNRDSDHPHVLDQLKQLPFYTDCVEDGKWTKPTDLIGKRIAELIVRTANLHLTEPFTTTKEVELWVEHLGSIEDGDFKAMMQGVAAWYDAMIDLGLRDEIPEEVKEAIQEMSPEDESRGG